MPASIHAVLLFTELTQYLLFPDDLETGVKGACFRCNILRPFMISGL